MNAKEVILDTLRSQGKSKERPDTDYNPIEMEIGKQVEKEHVKLPEASAEIAKDHLDENPFYYTDVLAPKEKDVMEITKRVLRKRGYSSIEEYRTKFKWKNKNKKYKE